MATTKSTTETRDRWAGLWPAFVVMLAAVGTLTTNIADPDLWGHYQYGKEVLRDGDLPDTTTWSYAVTGHPWINHENLSELATAWAADTFGSPGLTHMKLLLACVIFGCVIDSGRRAGAGWFGICLISVLAADNMRFHWQFRPHAWTYAFFAIMLAVLSAAFAHWKGQWRNWKSMVNGSPVPPPSSELKRLLPLWWLPPLLCVWTNTHGGFAAGLAILCAYLGLRAVEGWAWWGTASIGLQKRLIMMGLAAGLATLINPYGPHLHLWMADTLGAAPPEIGDWAPLPIWTTQATGFWLLMAVIAFSLAKSKLPKDPVHLVIMSLVLWQSVAHCRHLCFFAMMAAFWIPKHFDSALQPFVADFRAKLAGRQPQSWLKPLITAPLVIWLAFLAAELGPRLGTVPVNRSEYPVSAMQFLNDQRLTGRTMVTFNWAQYAIACFANDPALASSTVAIDGRLNTCYPRDVLDIYLDFLLGPPTPQSRLRAPESPPYSPTAALSYEEPDLFLLDRGQKPAIRTISTSPDWVLLYQDSLAQVWGSKQKYDTPGSPDYVSPERRKIGEDLQTGAVEWPAFPKADESVQLATAQRSENGSAH
jgi:hypothetical protein